MVTPPHFRTNILTGKCGFGGSAPCVARDPWYYRSGCDIPKEEKIEVLKKSRSYDYVVYQCNINCDRGNSKYFCEQTLMGDQEIYCKEIISCESVSCD